MHEALIVPIKERIELGYSKDEIKKEVVNFGYSEAEFEEAYNAAAPSTASQSSGAVYLPHTNEANITTKKSHWGIWLLLIFILLLGAAAGFGYYYLNKTPIDDPLAGGAYDAWRSELGEDQIVELVNPSIVRITTHFTGTTTLPAIDIDLDTLEVTLDESGTTTTRTFEQRVFGSGFIVSRDGKIVTNAHVVTPEVIRMQLYAQLIAATLTGKLFALDLESVEEAGRRFEALAMDDDGTLARESKEFIMEHSSLEYIAEVVVIDPTGAGSSFNARIEDGFPATVLSADEQFMLNDRDVALIKIDETELPALKLGATDPVSVGDPVYAFGFPAVTDFSRSNTAKSSFTDGKVSSIKDSLSGAFELIQTDAKISQGSSGGPLVDKSGAVVGIVTAQTESGESAYDEGSGAQGDNFAFAIPTSALDTLPGATQNDDDALFYDSFLSGMFLLENKHCERALEAFDQIDTFNLAFNANGVVDEYKNECNDLIAQGVSIDTQWDKAKIALRSLDNIVLIVSAASAITILILIVVVVMLIKQVKRNRQRLRSMK